MRFSRQEWWSELPFPSPGDLPSPGIEPGSPSLRTDSCSSGDRTRPSGQTMAQVKGREIHTCCHETTERRHLSGEMLEVSPQEASIQRTENEGQSMRVGRLWREVGRKGGNERRETSLKGNWRTTLGCTSWSCSPLSGEPGWIPTRLVAELV